MQSRNLSGRAGANSLSHGAALPSSVFSCNSLPRILERAAAFSTGIVITTKNDTQFLAYKDLLASAERVLRGLRYRGLKPQDRVIIQLQSRYFFICLWSCFLGGYVPVPLGMDRTGSDRLRQTWELCDSPTVITDSDISGIDTVTVEKLLDNERDLDWHKGNLDDLALLLFTSGSTGKPKGVMLSGRNLIASVYGMATVNNLSQRDISLNWMPLEHVASLVMFHLTEVYLGCQQIQVESELILQNPLSWLDLIHQYRVTATWSPNFAYDLVNEQLLCSPKHDWDLSCVRWMGNGAEAVVGRTAARFLELLTPYGLSPQVVSPGYGMSETTSGIAHSHDFYRHLDRDFVSVGAPIPGVSLRIVDGENQIIPAGEIGLLQVKGETVTAGYYRQPELNQEIFTTDGWFNTGDLGFLQSGQLTITGRQKDVIIINGANYYNHEIEAVVEEIAGVNLSYTAACMVADSQQQQVAIFLNTDLQGDKLRELVNTIRKNVFTRIGVSPAYIIPVTPETIPKTAIGKIVRSQLSQRFAAGEFTAIVNEIGSLFTQRDLSQQDLPGNAIEQRLVEIWQEVLGLDKIGVKDNFFELGGNSLLLMQVLGKLTPDYNLSAVTLFQYPTITDLASYLNSDGESLAVQQGKRRGELRRQAIGNKNIAVIGMSCRFPGANNITEFWSNLCNGVESITWFSDREIVASGVDPALVDDPNYVKASPILDKIEEFDAEFWGYSPKEAQLLDPQQRLFMECAWESLEDAGYDPLTYTGEISLYGGAATNTYLLNNIYPNRHNIDNRDSLQVLNLSSMGGFQVSTANDKDYLTTRTSYKLNLTGSSVNVQTACSTSLVTVHLACQSLINAECDLALAGGVSVHSPQKMGYLYQEGMILSPDGHCRAFDAGAEGTIFGSGAGMVVLKLLDRAVEDGDRIYGVIKGSAVNNDGGSKVGYLAPNVDGQTRVISEAIAYADIEPESVSYIEAHGTGTKLGDPIEITALSQAYQHDTRKEGVCAIGSVKTNVGHLQMASGIVGLIKSVLCLYNQKIPASLHFNKPNPQIDFASTPFYINTQLQKWKSELCPRRAGVNSLGIGGTNAHIILEEFVVDKEFEDKFLPAYLLTLSAKNKSALKEQIANYRRYVLGKLHEAPLRDICFTSNIGRHHFDCRLGITASNKQELIDKLSTASVNNSLQDNNKIAFLFTGQGSQYLGMARELYNLHPVFRETVTNCLAFLPSDLSEKLWEIFFLQSRRGAEDNKGDIKERIGEEYRNRELETEIGREKLIKTEYVQPLLFIVEYSLARLWLSWGVKPDVMMGHSLGEYVAAAIANVFSLEDALKLVSLRGKLMQDMPGNGAMLAAFVENNRLEYLLEDDINIAADNGTHFVLSGLKEDIDILQHKLKQLKIKTQLLNVSHAFHSSLMLPMVAKFKAVAATINYSLPEISVVSNLTGELAGKEIATPDYWVQHILQPVQFAKSINYLNSQQVNIFLEIGVKPTLVNMTQGILDNKQNIYSFSLNPKQADWQNILTSLAQLYEAGLEINWQAVMQIYNGNKISLPTYPFQRQRHWFDIPKQDRYVKPANNIHPLLGTVLSSPLKQTIFQSYLNINSISWLKEHVVNDKIIFPGTAYIEIAIALAKYKLNSDRLVLQNLSIDFPLVIKETIEVQSILTSNNNLIAWEIYSQKDEEWQLHCAGEAYLLESELTGKSLVDLQHEFNNSEIDIQQHYLSCQQKGINYGLSFQGIKQLWAQENKALGLIQLPDDIDTRQYNFHPALLDACLQILLAALPKELQANTHIPVGLEKLSIQSLPHTIVWSYLELKLSNNKILLADVWLYNDAGELIVQITGLKSQAVTSKPTWHSWLYQPQWLEKPLLTSPRLSSTGDWLIFANNNSVANQLAEKIGSPCHLITRDSIVNQPQAFIDLLQQYPNLTGIIYLWSLDNAYSDTEWESYLYLVRALIQSDNNPRLWFVTHNARVVNEGVTAGIKNSCLWGMQKAIAIEHPELSCVGIDIDCLDNAANCIINEISESQEQVAYRQDKRYVSRLVKYDSNANKEYSLDNLQLKINNPGNLDSLQWQPIVKHTPKDNQIEVEVKATGLNFRDVMVALDLYPDETKFLGLECAGVITRVGKDVTNFKPGDEVIAIADSSFSQYLLVDSQLAIHKPEFITYEAAATIPVTFLTAYYTLVYLAQLQPGEKVLIHAAAGGVGLAAIQIARQLGVEIYATASTLKWSLLKSMGVKNIMNSRSLNFADEIMSCTNNKGVDVVLNSLSGEYIPKSLGVLNPQGRFIEIGKQGIWSQADIERVQPDIEYSIVDLWQITQNKPELIQQMLSELLPQFATGKLKPLPQTVYSGKRIIEAFRYMQQSKHRGKIVISLDNAFGKGEWSFTHMPTYTGTYLVTGGMGAIGLRVVQWLIDKGVTNLVLLGRSDIKPKYQAQLQKLQEKAQINLIKADIADTNQLVQAFAQIESELPLLKGVIHCAGITSDRTISKQDRQSFIEVFAPKVRGAWNLHNLTQKYDLENFILFSSASSLIGSAGQANYCAANAFLDTLAQARRSMGLPATSINWSAWQNTGMAKDVRITAGLKQKGIGSIEPDLGIEILEYLAKNSPAQIGVMPIDWNIWQQHHTVTPYYENLVTVNNVKNMPVNIAVNEKGDRQQLLAATPEQRETVIIKQITQQVGNILGIKNLNNIDLELGFSELGLDSLSSVELRNKLQSSYALKLSQTIIFDYPNVRQLGIYLLSLMCDCDSKAQDSNESDRLETIANLSEEDAEAALLAELENLEY